MHTKKTLMEDLQRMGLKPEDTVLVHSSMKAIGPVEGKADTVLDALSEYFAPGLLMFPTLTWDLAYEKDPVFNVKNSPSQVGILPQLFRQREHVVRSCNPTHSVAALGRDAQEVTKDGHVDGTPCGFHSPWYKLVERDGYILQVGCTLTTCTFIHGVEEWCDIPERLDAPVDYTVVKADGETMQVTSRPHKGHPSEQFWKAEKALHDAGVLEYVTLGDAKVMKLSARGCYEVVKKLLEEDPDLFAEEHEA